MEIFFLSTRPLVGLVYSDGVVGGMERDLWITDIFLLSTRPLDGVVYSDVVVRDWKGRCSFMPLRTSG
jgi:hypothetical protein